MSYSLPNHVIAEHGSKRNWIKTKRKEMKELRKAMDTIRLGCAFLPKEAYLAITQADSKINEAYNVCKKWWAKS